MSAAWSNNNVDLVISLMEKARYENMKKGYSRPRLFGTMNHYDNSGHKVGESTPGLFGSVNTYDSNGNKT